MEQKYWNVLNAGLALAGVCAAFAAAFWIYKLTKVDQENVRKLQLLQHAPEVFYDWRTNYFTLRLQEKGDARAAALALNGVLTIRNQSARPLNAFSVIGVFGYDPQLVLRPFSTQARGRKTLFLTQARVDEGRDVEIDIVKNLRDNGFDLELFFTADHEKWDKAESDPRLMPLVGDGQILTLDTKRPLGAPFWGEDLAPYALYGRIIVSYSSQGLTYSHVLTAVIGFALPIGDAAIPAGSYACYLNKQGYAKVATTSQSHEAIIIPQVVYNHDDTADTTLPPGRHLATLHADNTRGGRFTFGQVIEIISQEEARRRSIESVPTVSENEG